jgi:SAM-dependent methyltransferase
VEFFEAPSLPVHAHLLRPTREEALRAPCAPIRLALCRACTHVFNAAFDPGAMEYSGTYENSLTWSGRYREYMSSLVDDLVRRYDLLGKRIVEIGCGNGEFIKLLCHRAQASGIGFDPSLGYDWAPAPDDRVEFIRDYFSEKYADLEASLVCCRQMLEHCEDPALLVRTARSAVGRDADGLMFVEVPNGLFMLEQVLVWDLLYEHSSYFTPSSLRRLLSANGLRVLRLADAYWGQYLVAEAGPAQNGSGEGSAEDGAAVARRAAAFRDESQRRIRAWEKRLRCYASRRLKVAAWGAGTKAVTFFNLVGQSSSIPYVVDINPKKHEHYVAGTGQRIVSPEFLRSYDPDLVLVMNELYLDEVGETLAGFGLRAELLTP